MCSSKKMWCSLKLEIFNLRSNICQTDNFRVQLFKKWLKGKGRKHWKQNNWSDRLSYAYRGFVFWLFLPWSIFREKDVYRTLLRCPDGNLDCTHFLHFRQLRIPGDLRKQVSVNLRWLNVCTSLLIEKTSRTLLEYIYRLYIQVEKRTSSAIKITYIKWIELY